MPVRPIDPTRASDQPFLDAITRRVLVCDGAMGTMLFADGVFVNRAFEELNVTEPERVASIHRAYVDAGADVIETNTFGANRMRLGGFGLADQMVAFNVEAVRIARSVAGDAYVAGAVGPLGVPLSPDGRTTPEEAAGCFREQGEALASAGIDLFVLETFRSPAELCVAIGALLAVTDLPIVAQLAVDDDGRGADGSPPESWVPRLVEAGATVVGVNCGTGPATMLEVVEQMQAVTGCPLAAQPNAGLPRQVEGRSIYFSTPSFVASYARRFAQSGVRLVGGCCGTTPDHIREMAVALRDQG